MPTVFGRDYPSRYDAIIIGSGIGGLFCANLLAKAGLKVLLLERHYMLGGFCSTFRRRGFIFDAATHFYPLLGNPTTLTGKLLQELEIPTEWVKMDPVDQFHLHPLGGYFQFLEELSCEGGGIAEERIKVRRCVKDEAAAAERRAEAAQHVVPLEEQYLQSGLCEEVGAEQPAYARSDDDRVITGRVIAAKDSRHGKTKSKG